MRPEGCFLRWLGSPRVKVRWAPLLLALGVLVAAGCEATRDSPTKAHADEAAAEAGHRNRPRSRLATSPPPLGAEVRPPSHRRGDGPRGRENRRLAPGGASTGPGESRRLRARTYVARGRRTRRKSVSPRIRTFVVKGCRSRASVARKTIESMVARKPVSPAYVATENARGDTFFEQAHNDLENVLRANRALPLVPESSTESRIDRRLSRAAVSDARRSQRTGGALLVARRMEVRREGMGGVRRRGEICSASCTRQRFSGQASLQKCVRGSRLSFTTERDDRRNSPGRDVVGRRASWPTKPSTS